MVITVWADATDNGLRLKVVSNTDVIAGVEHRFISSEPEEVLGFIRSWISAFGDATVTQAEQRHVSVVRQDPPEASGNPKRKGK